MLVMNMLAGNAVGFSIYPLQHTHLNKGLRATANNDNENKRKDSVFKEVSRREILLGSTTTAISSLLLLHAPPAAVASGGATAGGPYLRSAKQRYNDRVTAGVTSYISLGKSLLKNADLGPSKTFFTDEDQWKDFASAAYLLSNAFRTSSSTAPDSLPSVQKWKAFAAQVGSFEKAVVKKKSLSSATVAYEKGLELLDPFLEAVSLPSVLEMGGAK